MLTHTVRVRVCFARVAVALSVSALATGASEESLASAQAADWSRDAQVPTGGRPNILGLDDDALAKAVTQGKLHALAYPVEATGALFPYEAVRNLLDEETHEPNPFRWLLRKFAGGLARLRRFADIEALVGVVPYPSAGDVGVYQVPRPRQIRSDLGMGTTLFEHGGATGLTFSCAACHAGRLFGKSVLGMTSRFPKANDFFLLGQGLTQVMGAGFFTGVARATPAEQAMYEKLRTSVSFIGAKNPLVEGLDTSLAQVGLSLAKRRTDADATRDAALAARPARNILDTQRADSKPSVWWNVKYKTRWLSDGSVVSGNPIYTNILWNEIGRGADLADVREWLDTNPAKIEELAAAVFASQAPRYTDFFPASSIDEPLAREGETLFEGNCARCHGSYVKAWSGADADFLSTEDRLRTRQVHYFARTPVVDVGTDPLRAQGMEGLAEGLNRLAISRENGVVVEVQRGYVPPPLEGIWARWSYFHNNSAPSLCAVLTRASDRPQTFFAGDAIDPATDFDSECVGYPTGDSAPHAWRARPDRMMDTRRAGLGNQGHDEGVFLQGGAEMYTPAQKRALIEFLKTL